MPPNFLKKWKEKKVEGSSAASPPPGYVCDSICTWVLRLSAPQTAVRPAGPRCGSSGPPGHGDGQARNAAQPESSSSEGTAGSQQLPLPTEPGAQWTWKTLLNRARDLCLLRCRDQEACFLPSDTGMLSACHVNT